MKKAMRMSLVLLVALALFTGCQSTGESKQSEASTETPTKTPSESPTKASTGKMVVNIEGTVSEVDEDRITLDNGQVVIVNENTAFTDAKGTVEDAVLAEGDFIQGYTEDDPAAAEVTAKRIHIVVF